MPRTALRVRPSAAAINPAAAAAVPLGRQPLQLPALARARVTDTVVEPVLAVLPELDRLRPQPVAAPVRRERDLASFVFKRELGVAGLELLAAREGTALL